MSPFAPIKRLKGLGRRLQQSEAFLNAVGKLAARHIRTVYSTSKVIREPADMDAYLEQIHPMIVAMWHGQFLLLPLIKPKTVQVSNMVARHSDGEMIGRMLLNFDMGLIRGAGASEKGKDRGGASALRAAVKALRKNITVAMTTDIPPGRPASPAWASSCSGACPAGPSCRLQSRPGASSRCPPGAASPSTCRSRSWRWWRAIRSMCRAMRTRRPWRPSGGRWRQP